MSKLHPKKKTKAKNGDLSLMKKQRETIYMKCKAGFYLRNKIDPKRMNIIR
jgi:hypothetical protein